MRNDQCEALRVSRKGRGSLSCRRFEPGAVQGRDPAGEQVVCFLPWLLGYHQCREARLLPPNVLAAYEMPHGIVSPCPSTSIEALQLVVDDFLELMRERDLDPANLTLLGLSIGNFAATYIANLIGARLWAIAPGDRGEALIWTSSIAAGLRKQAEARGYSFSDFGAALREFNPINNLHNLKAGSTFVAGRFDSVVPYRSAMKVTAAARAHNPATRSIVLPLGHSGTLFAGVQFLRLRFWHQRR